MMLCARHTQANMWRDMCVQKLPTILSLVGVEYLRYLSQATGQLQALTITIRT